MNHIKEITEQFLGTNNFKDYKVINGGLINKTYLVTSINNEKYILQQINTLIFKDVQALMDNLILITEHFNKKIKSIPNDIPIQSFHYIPLINDAKYFYKHIDNSYWRLSDFIENTPINTSIISSKTAEQSGYLFAFFIREMADIDVSRIHFTIPDFHATHLHYKNLHKAACDNTFSRLKETQKLFKRIKSYHWLIKAYKKILKNKSLPLRLVHNDPKSTNILFDKQSNAIAIIDLDTCMPDYLMSDFGDAIRSLTNTGNEDDKDLNNISFDMKLFENYTKGFLNATKGFIMQEEKENLALFSLLMTYEQAIRFYTDYLMGDSYYKIDYPSHNLQRTKVQLKLLDEMFTSFDEMKKIIS